MDSALSPAGAQLAASTKTNRRPLLLAAARAEFASHGYDGASVESIARRAGIKKSSLFHYFASKRDLYAAAIGDLVAELTHDVAGAAAHGADDDPSGRIGKVVDAIVARLAAEPPAARLLVRGLVEGMDDRPPAEEPLAGLIDVVRAAIAGAAVDDGRPLHTNGRTAARTFIGVVCLPLALAEHATPGAASTGLERQLAQAICARDNSQRHREEAATVDDVDASFPDARQDDGRELRPD